MDLDEIKTNFEEFQEDIETEYDDMKKDFQEFLRVYPFKKHPEKIDSLTPEDIYNPGNPSFLYYIEHKLNHFGSIKLGSSKYAYNARDQINEFKSLLKIVVDDSKSIAEKLDAPWDKIKFWGGDRHVAKKVIFCYNIDKVMSIYNTNDLEDYANLFDRNHASRKNEFGKAYDGLTLGEKFEYLNEIILRFKNENIDSNLDNSAFMMFLYRYYPPSRIH